MTLKVCTIVGTRPELIKLARVIPACDSAFEHVLVHTGQNYDYELNEIFFEELGIRKPDRFLGIGGGVAAEAIGRVITEGDALLREIEPDALLVLGDTNSCLVTIAAKKLKIPIFHMEAGNRCFDQRVPEEVNRRIVDHTSDINLTYTEHARRYLLREGFPPERVIKTGSPMYEVLHAFRDEIDASDVLTQQGLEAERYFVVSAHREENVDSPDRLASLIEGINRVAEAYDFPVVFSVHPRTKKRMEDADLAVHPHVRLLPPFGFFAYIKLQMNAACVLSDSGTVTEESSVLGFPAVTLRQAHERPEGMDHGVLIMSGIEPERIEMSVRLAMTGTSRHEPFTQLVDDYLAPHLSAQVVKLIASYVGYVNRTVWYKDV